MSIKIALDCGHGLNIAGKQTPDGIKEWTLNDKVRDKVVALLADYDCEFIHTDNNEGNTDESLASRVNAYLNKGVAAFVSIHHNAFTGSWNNATGVEVYTDRNYTEEDQKLAEAIYPKLVSYTGLKGRGIKREDWWVINQDRIAAVLIEGGFMDGSNDYKVITSEDGQTAYAKAVAEGLIEFLGLEKKASVTDTNVSVKKTVDELAKEVMAGLHGNGHENRKASLLKQGYDNYEEVRARVNELCGVKATHTPQKQKKTVDELAKEVIRGVWGNGADRRKRLTEAGYDYDSIQKKVNEYYN